MASSNSNDPYTSKLSIPYSSHSPLNTLDIHTPTTPPHPPTYHLIYLHGGAFRDPLVTSRSLLPSLPSIFRNPNNHFAAIASLNYRLSPHPRHPTHPSSPDDPSRNARWPVHIEDVRDAVAWLREHGGMGGKEWVVCGHSVGGTMALMLGLELPTGEEGKWGRGDGKMEGLKGVVGLEGIYDFTACRDAHPSNRGLYDEFTTGAFGPEEEGGWERGNVVRSGRKVSGEVELVMVVHSREDELVEWEQAGAMMEVLRKQKRDDVVVFLEVEGKHQQIVTEGRVIGKVVIEAVNRLLEKASGSR